MATGATIGSALLGVSLVVACVPGLICNTIVGLTIVTQGLLRKAASVFYIPSFNLIVCDTIQLFNIIYMGLCGILQTAILPDQLAWIPEFSFLWMWHEMWFMLLLLSFNRFMGVCFPVKCAVYFSPVRTRIFTGVSWLLSLATVSISQLPNWCCKLIIVPAVYTISWNNPSQDILWVDYLIEWPGNAGTTLVIIVCYAGIWWKVHKTNVTVADSLNSEEQAKRQAKELKFAIQFVVISIFFVVAWVIFRVLPAVMPAGYLKPFAVLSFIVIANSSINSFVLLALNLEIKENFGKMLGFRGATPTQTLRTQYSTAARSKVHRIRDRTEENQRVTRY